MSVGLLRSAFGPREVVLPESSTPLKRIGSKSSPTSTPVGKSKQLIKSKGGGKTKAAIGPHGPKQKGKTREAIQPHGATDRVGMPNVCIVRSRSLVQCRTGWKGKGQNPQIYYGEGRKHATADAALSEGKEWLHDQMVKK